MKEEWLERGVAWRRCGLKEVWIEGGMALGGVSYIIINTILYIILKNFENKINSYLY